MKVTRRHVLAVVACSGAAALAGVGGLAVRWWDRPAGEGLLALSADEHEVAQALAEAWMPPGGTPSLSGAEARVGDFLDRVLAHAPDPEGKLLKLLLQALDDATVPTRLSAFRHLPLDSRQEVLRGWLASDVAPLREAVRTLLILMSEGYSMHPDVQPELQTLFPCGYGGLE